MTKPRLSHSGDMSILISQLLTQVDLQKWWEVQACVYRSRDAFACNNGVACLAFTYLNQVFQLLRQMVKSSMNCNSCEKCRKRQQLQLLRPKIVSKFMNSNPHFYLRRGLIYLLLVSYFLVIPATVQEYFRQFLIFQQYVFLSFLHLHSNVQEYLNLWLQSSAWEIG